MAGSIYTYIGNNSSSSRIAAIDTAQGQVAIGQSGLFIAADVASAVSRGCILEPGPSVSPAPYLTAPAAVAGAAGVLTGVYRYAFTFVTAAGETKIGPEVTVTLASQEGSLSNIPLGNAVSGVTARKMYRTVAGGASGTEKLVATISDNTTTTTIDNLADGSLGALAPTADTSSTIAGGGGAATQVSYAELTENPADDVYAISAGTGEKLTSSSGGGGGGGGGYPAVTSGDGSVSITGSGTAAITLSAPGIATNATAISTETTNRTAAVSAAIATAEAAAEAASDAVGAATAALTKTLNGAGTPAAITTAGTVSHPVELLDATGGAFIRTLPTAVGFTGVYVLEAISAGVNLVTLATTSSQTIDTYASGALTLGTQLSGAPYRAVTLISDNANWRII